MKVAFNKIKITPNNYIGMPLAGYTREEPCLGKLDDIQANGILIESSSKGTPKKMLIIISMVEEFITEPWKMKELALLPIMILKN